MYILYVWWPYMPAHYFSVEMQNKYNYIVYTCVLLLELSWVVENMLQSFSCVAEQLLRYMVTKLWCHNISLGLITWWWWAGGKKMSEIKRPLEWTKVYVQQWSTSTCDSSVKQIIQLSTILALNLIGIFTKLKDTLIILFRVLLWCPVEKYFDFSWIYNFFT